MNTQITQKQKDFIIKLDPTQKEETLNNLTIKEASYLIKSLLKGSTDKAQKSFGPCDLSIINYEALKAKYNVSYEMGKDGRYNDNNGSNCHSPLLQDSRKFKSYINNIFKTEFKGVDIKSKVSFAYSCYDNVEITIRAPKNELYSSYALLSGQERNACCYRYTRNELTNAAAAALYDRVIKNSKEQRNALFLSDKYLKLYNFINDLLSSYSYNHSDIMTDYYDNGLRFVIYFEATDREEINEYSIYNMNSDDIIKQFGLADEVSEEAH